MDFSGGTSDSGRTSACGSTYRRVPIALFGSFELGGFTLGFLTGFFEADEFSPGVEFGGCAIGGVDGGYGAVFLGYAT